MITYNNSTTILFPFIISFYFLAIGQLHYVPPLRVGFICHLLMYYSVPFYVILYSYLKRMKHFLIPVSVFKADHRRTLEIVIFIATKTLWFWLSHLTRSLDEKALEKSSKWLLFCSLIFKAGFQQADFCVFGRCVLDQCACSPAQKFA